MSIQEYKKIENVKDNIFSSLEWERYSIQQSFQCTTAGFLAALFIGVYLIGIFAKNKRMAKISEGVLLTILALSWCAIGLIIHINSQQGIAIIWGLILIITFCGSLYSFRKSRNS